MSGWDTTPAPAADGGFQADNSFKAVTGTKDGKDFRFAVENISRHADGEVGEAPHDGGCRNCGDPSHFGRDCPTKPDQGCFNCGEAGHMKSECTNERVEREFTGTCLACGLAGHRRAECSDAPAQTCNICKQLDHKASECTVSRMTAYIDSLNIEELPPDVAWKALEAADQDRDVDDIKRAILAYAKVVPNITFEEFEKVFRSSGFNTYIIAKQQAVADTHTIVQFQGVTDQEFVWSIQFSPDPRRKMSVGGWPATLEINLERLKKTGIAMDRMVPKCSNCEQLGHNSRGCPEEKREVQKNRISCANCSSEGHYSRDCKEPRKQPREPIECKNCYQHGHKAADCPNERVVECFNCNQKGHSKQDCTEPRRKTDWSTVTCSICKEMGHSYKRCPQAPKEEEEAGGGDGGFGDGAGDAGGASNGGW